MLSLSCTLTKYLLSTWRNSAERILLEVSHFRSNSRNDNLQGVTNLLIIPLFIISPDDIADNSADGASNTHLFLFILLVGAANVAYSGQSGELCMVV